MFSCTKIYTITEFMLLFSPSLGKSTVIYVLLFIVQNLMFQLFDHFGMDT